MSGSQGIPANVLNDADFMAWLTNPTNKSYQRLLVVAHNDTATLRFSDLGYTDNLLHIPYPRWFSENGLPKIETNISQSVAIGSFTVFNELTPDLWENYNFAGYNVELYLGDVRWNFFLFKAIATAVIDGVVRDNNKYTFNLTDHASKLNTAVQTNKNADDKLMPLFYGEPFNIKPQFIEDFPQSKWRFYDGPFQGTITVFDIGLDITNHVTIDYANGTYTYNTGHQPAGDQRINAVSTIKTVPQIAQDIATRHGLGTVITTNFTAWHNSAVMSLNLNGDTINKVLDDLMYSIGGYAIMDELGAIELIVPGTANPTIKLTKHNIGEDGIKPLDTIQPHLKAVVNYGKNWSTQNASDLSSTMSQADIDKLSTEYKTTEIVTGVTHGADSITFNTLLANEADAIIFRDNRKTKFAVEQKRYALTISDIANLLRVGMPISVDCYDHQFNAVVSNMDVQLGEDFHSIEVML